MVDQKDYHHNQDSVFAKYLDYDLCFLTPALVTLVMLTACTAALQEHHIPLFTLYSPAFVLGSDFSNYSYRAQD